MREIKFRAWDEMNQVMKIPEGIQIIRKYSDSKSGYSFKLENDLVILMQYTGLKDKNGVEIYEGDIVQFNTRAGGIFVRTCWFDEQNAAFKLGGFTYTSEDLKQMQGEVIGNIYENGDLLK